MRFLNNRVINQADPQTVDIHDILIRAYFDKYEALSIAGQVGILPADIAVQPKMRFTWWSILEEAAKNHLMHRLMNTILKDPTVAGYHDDLRQALEMDGQAFVEAPLTKIGDQPVVGMPSRLWPVGQTLKVRFLEGNPTLHDKVETVARSWLSYANLDLDFDNHPDAELRISFSLQGSWSYIGTDALKVADPEPNINFGWLTPDSPEEEIQQVVLHEFGHVLGLLHEHGHPLSNLDWAKEAVYAELFGPPNYWNKEQVDRLIFEIWPPDYFPVRKIFDRESIMMFPIPAKFLISGQAIKWNVELSPLDQQFVAAIYPMRSRKKIGFLDDPNFNDPNPKLSDF